MGLFSLNNILLEEGSSDDVIDIDKIGYMSDVIRERSFVQEGYNAILEMNAYYCNAEKEFYTRIGMSAGDSSIINEGFSDFFNKIKDIIKKFIEWIKKVFKEFAAKLAALVGSEKYIKKHKDLLNKFNSEDEFEFQGYKYTEIERSNIPVAKAVDMFQSNSGAVANVSNGLEFLSFAGNFTNLDNGDYYKFNTGMSDKVKLDSSNQVDNNEIKRRREATDKINAELSKRIENVSDKNEDFYDEFRGIVIDKAGTKLDSKEFTEELFKVFRDGDDSTSSITIDYNFVHDSYRRFDKYKDTIKDIEKVKKDIIKDYEDLEKYLDKMIKYNKDTRKIDITTTGGRDYTTNNLSRIDFGMTKDNLIYDASTSDRMQSLLKVYSARVNQMCQIHTQAFSAKLEAAKDCFNQDKKILNKAIQQILKRSDKEGF